MTNTFSRRSFLRTAGAAALVAASAMLTGCGSKEITVNFYDTDTGALISTKTVRVDPDATSVTWDDLRSALPAAYKDYYRKMDGDAARITGSGVVNVYLSRETKPVFIYYYDSADRDSWLCKYTAQVEADATYVTWAEAAPGLPAGYEHYADKSGNAGKIQEGNVVQLYLTPKTAT